jgi:sialate O-acetylesterase
LVLGYNSIRLQNVLIGEVWLCSGQSNMEWKPTSGITNADKAIASANQPKIRFFTVDHRTATDPQIDVASSGWLSCTPETMKDFSAIAYFFARRIVEETGVPVGLINSSWGGTPAEAWTPESVYQKNELLAKSAAMLDEVPWGPVQPGRIFNAMIAPVTKFRIAGPYGIRGNQTPQMPTPIKRRSQR